MKNEKSNAIMTEFIVQLIRKIYKILQKKALEIENEIGILSLFNVS